MSAGGAGMVDQREKTRGSASQTTGASSSVLCGAWMPPECRAGLAEAQAATSSFAGASFFVWASAAAVMRLAMPVKITPWNGTREYQ